MEPIKRVLLAILASTAPAVYAADTPFTPLEPLTAELELGLISITGNTQSTAVKSKATIKQDFTAWKAKYLIDSLYKRGRNEGETDTKTTAQKLFLSAQSDYKLSSNNTSIFVYGSYTDDRFSGYEYQNTLSVGYSARLFQNDNAFLDYSVGPGYSFSKTEEGEEERASILHLELQYEYQLSSNATFQQMLSTEAAFEDNKNTRSKSETSINVQLKDNLSMKASYGITHNSQVLDDKKKTDGITSIIFAYTF